MNWDDVDSGLLKARGKEGVGVRLGVTSTSLSSSNRLVGGDDSSEALDSAI